MLPVGFGGYINALAPILKARPKPSCSVRVQHRTTNPKIPALSSGGTLGTMSVCLGFSVLFWDNLPETGSGY